jgi:hypothetical protein
MDVVKCASPFASRTVDVSREVKIGPWESLKRHSRALRKVQRGARELKCDTRGELFSSSGKMRWKSIIY